MQEGKALFPRSTCSVEWMMPGAYHGDDANVISSRTLAVIAPATSPLSPLLIRPHRLSSAGLARFLPMGAMARYGATCHEVRQAAPPKKPGQAGVRNMIAADRKKIGQAPAREGQKHMPGLLFIDGRETSWKGIFPVYRRR